MKKLFILILSFLFIVSCKDEPKKVSLKKNKEIISMFNSKYPDDKFYFIQGLDYEKDINTNIRYRGILYSDRLEKLGYPFGMELALEENDDGWVYLSDYEAMFLKIEVDKPIEQKMKEIFGELSVLNNNFYPSLEGFRGMLKIIGKEIPFEDKGRADYTVVNLFVDRLEDINKEEMKKKTYEFAKFMQDEINLKTYLQVYIRDNSFFEDYKLVFYQVYPSFREKEEIKKILEKIKNKEKISQEEKVALVKVFYKGFNYKMRNTDININFIWKELKKYTEQEFGGELLWEDYIDERSK